MVKSVIHFIITGGTIDSVYDGTKDTAVPAAHSAIPPFFKRLQIRSTAIHCTEICMKDSRALRDADRRKILQAVEKSRCKQIIITHGTYTMPETARYLKIHLKRKDQTIVFTGSFIPMTGFTPSDAPFNLGYAFAKVQELFPRSYVCMNGEVFTPEEVEKIVEQGRFASIFQRSIFQR